MSTLSKELKIITTRNKMSEREVSEMSDKMIKEERIINVRVVERNDRVEIIIDDKDLVEYIYDWFDDYEIHFNIDDPERPLLVIKFYSR